jgi:hypothetical protein
MPWTELMKITSKIPKNLRCELSAWKVLSKIFPHSQNERSSPFIINSIFFVFLYYNLLCQAPNQSLERGRFSKTSNISEFEIGCAVVITKLGRTKFL